MSKSIDWSDSMHQMWVKGPNGNGTPRDILNELIGVWILIALTMALIVTPLICVGIYLWDGYFFLANWQWIAMPTWSIMTIVAVVHNHHNSAMSWMNFKAVQREYFE